MDQLPSPAHKITASDQTLSRLGWITSRLSDIAQADLILITKNDVLQQPGEPILSTPISRLSQIFDRAGIPPERQSQLNSFQIAFSAVNNNPAALAVDFDDDRKTDVGIITMPDIDLTPRTFVSFMTGIPPEFVKDNLPGNGRDYLASIMFHESRHIAQHNGEEKRLTHELPYELDADNHMLKEMDKATREGVVSDPAVMDVFKDVRRIAGLGQDSYLSMMKGVLDLNPASGVASHSTHLGLDQPALPEAGAAYAKGMMLANSIVSVMAGNFMAVEGLRQIQENPDPGNDRIFSDALQGIQVMTDPVKTAELGRNSLSSDPALAYLVLHTAKEKGYIRPNTPEGAYADRVTGFFEKHIDLDGLDKGRLDSARDYFAKIPSAGDVKFFDTGPDTPRPSQTPNIAPQSPQ